MKLLLIEDRPERKRIFTEAEGIDFDRFPFLTICEGEEYKKLQKLIQADNLDWLQNYDLIMCHKSAFSLNEQDKLDNLCKVKGKALVYFSGGISASFYDESKNPVLHINSKDFYSKNLIHFLESVLQNNEIELLILEFGERWKLNLMLIARDELSKLFYLNSGNHDYIEPEDFQKIFPTKTLSVFPSELSTELSCLTENGVVGKAMDILLEVKEKISNAIQNEIGTQL